ncbi:MAG: hypothetical protein M1819_004244 [Sarea resinae]|nr:MAG: hypothetical protein M1819_004244 [Sarea resinae]
MAKIPAAKRRRLSPVESRDDEGSSSSTLQGDSTANSKGSSDFYSRAAKWDLEQDYEQRPRKLSKKEKESTRLPIKTAEGRIEQMEAAEPAVGDDDSFLDSEEDGEEEQEEEVVPDVPKVSSRQQIIEAKEELARIAGLINEDPEEHAGLFRKLAQVSSSGNITIKKLALATQLAVYKDVIPGYRIRPASEDEMKTKLSKEVRQLRNFEQSLVSGYQAYIKDLARLAKGSKADSSEDKRGLATVAISCACALLLAVPHFNFRGDLLKILVDKMSARTVDADFLNCTDTLEQLFREDEDGTPSLDAVTLLARMMKARHYRVDESVLNTFLHLRLLSEFSSKGSQNHVDKTEEQDSFKGKKLKQKREFRTKKQRKLEKERKVVETEMKEADATVSHEERDRMQAETLKLVFVTYFRILKARSAPLMGAVLEGLAKYAHLINQDFFGDLLEALKDLIAHAEAEEDADADADGEDEEADDAEPTTSRNPSRSSLLCIITAFALLEGQDASAAASSLSLDLNFFITHLYRTLYPLALNPDLELSAKSLHLPDPDSLEHAQMSSSTNKINVQTTVVLFLRCLSSVLLPPIAVRAVPPLRVAAFSKQILTSSLQMPEKSCLASLGLMNKVTKTHGRKVSALWHTEERRGDGTFDPLRGEVEGSNPFASTVWEGELLRKHYCPKVREAVAGVEGNILSVR